MSDGLLRDYPHGRAFDEAIDRHGVPRGAYAEVLRWLESYGAREFERRRQLIDLVFRNQGITFTAQVQGVVATLAWVDDT